MRRFVIVGSLVAACGTSLTPVEPPPEPGGTLAVQFTIEFAGGHWGEGDHAYRLELRCPELETNVEPPVVRLPVEPSATLFEDRVWLRFDGPSTSRLSPSDLPSIHPDQRTGAIMTLVGLDEREAHVATSGCEATVVYDGNDPVPLMAEEPFIP